MHLLNQEFQITGDILIEKSPMRARVYETFYKVYQEFFRSTRPVTQRLLQVSSKSCTLCISVWVKAI